jgi:predicted esterase
LGFSQGACLALEFAARHARRYGGLVGLSGALIGPEDTPRDYPGSLAGTPVYLGCSDVDPHVPKERVDQSARVLKDLGGIVTERIYPQMGHTINPDEISSVRQIMEAVLAGL